MPESTGTSVGMRAAQNTEPNKAGPPMDENAETAQSTSHSTQHGLPLTCRPM